MAPVALCATGADSVMTQQTSPNQRQNNKRTALILLSIALVFFLGVIARRWLLGE